MILEINELYAQAKHIQVILEAESKLSSKNHKDPHFYYKLLGCTRESTDAEIKKAHRSMMLKFHPDKCPKMSPGFAQKATRMVIVMVTFSLLK